MKESNELLELCKQVYEATGWKQSPNISQLYEYWDDHDELCVISIEDADDALVPAYTSDYLLEKLPSVVQDPYDKIFRHIQMWINGDRSAHAGYVEPYAHDDRVAYAQKSDEMRITLLKLTLKLHKEELL